MDSLYSAFIINAREKPRTAWELFTYSRSQPVLGTEIPATTAHTNVPRAGYSGLPMGWDASISHWRATLNVRYVEQPVIDWASEVEVCLIYNGKRIEASPLLDLLFSTRPVRQAEDHGQMVRGPAWGPLWIRENCDYRVEMLCPAKAFDGLQRFLVEHTSAGVMTGWVWLEGVVRQDVR